MVMCKALKWEEGDRMEWLLDYQHCLVLKKHGETAYRRLKNLEKIKSYVKYIDIKKD